LRDFVVRVVPSNSFKDLPDILLLAHAPALRRGSTHRMEHAVGRVNAVKVFRDFGAQKSPGYWMRRIALQLDRAAKIIDGDQNSARIGAIV
jgi:4'-phosphopantetheinyl transferase EntD